METSHFPWKVGDSIPIEMNKINKDQADWTTVAASQVLGIEGEGPTFLLSSRYMLLHNLISLSPYNHCTKIYVSYPFYR